MTILKKTSMAALFAAMLSLVATAATVFSAYFAVSVPAPGTWRFGSGLGQVSHVRISGAYPTNGTVILYWVNNAKSLTNSAFLSVTATNGGFYEADITNGAWFLAGDYITRAGTVTNTSECTLIFTGQQ